MNKNLVLILIYMYPNAEPSIDFQVGEFGRDDFRIVDWNARKLGLQPTPEALAAAEPEALAARDAKEAERVAANTVIETTARTQRDLTASEMSNAIKALCRRAMR